MKKKTKDSKPTASTTGLAGGKCNATTDRFYTEEL